jgi:hypothetical protein
MAVRITVEKGNSSGPSSLGKRGKKRRRVQDKIDLNMEVLISRLQEPDAEEYVR